MGKKIKFLSILISILLIISILILTTMIIFDHINNKSNIDSEYIAKINEDMLAKEGEDNPNYSTENIAGNTEEYSNIQEINEGEENKSLEDTAETNENTTTQTNNNWVDLDGITRDNIDSNKDEKNFLNETQQNIENPEDIIIKVDKSTITRRGVTLVVTDSNNREKDLSLTLEYVIDKKVNGQWVRVPGWENQIVPALLIRPHSRHVVNWFKDYGELEPGIYRILLPYNGGHIAYMDKICISEEFEIF